jgi:ubiquinone/menaquinone biosynthesis C-methylase UbiE
MDITRYSTWRISPWRRIESKKILGFINSSGTANRIVEVGSAEGYILNKAKAGEKYGFDSDSKSIERGRSSYPDIKFSVQDAEKTNFKDSFFDSLLCLHLLEHVKNPEKAVSECSRILKKGGKAVFAVPCERIKGDTTLFPKYHLHKFRHSQLFEMLKKHFTVEKAYFNTLIPFVFKEIKNSGADSIIYNLSYSMMFFCTK